MIHQIIGFALIVIGMLVMNNMFIDPIRHYVVVIEVGRITSELTFSMDKEESLTIEFLKNKFNYSSNDVLVITDIREIDQKEKNRRLSK